MYKIYTKKPGMSKGHASKLWLIMRLIAIILITGFMQVYAVGFAQKISLSQSNAPLKTVLIELRLQSGYNFVYTDDLLSMAKPIDINVNEAEFEDVLVEIFKEQPLTYAIHKNTITVKEKVIILSKGVIEDHKDIVVRGIITDSNGETLPRVSIKLKGFTIGTTTDLDGRYTINVPDRNSVLVFTYIGYISQELIVGDRTTLNVKLETANTALTEVVVTALGISREKRALAYSVSEVKGDELTQARETNVANSLSGKVAGVNVSGNATGPGGSSRVIIRGNGSLAGNNQPLYVVNGMPIDNTIPGGGTVSSGGGINIDRGDGIAGINPDDIESISVLKGGAAAALYGSRASNGVILIATKKGVAQKGIGVEFNSTSTFDRPSMYPDWQYEYGQGVDGVKPATTQQALSSGRLSFGPRMDGEPSIQIDGKMHPYSPVYVKDNINNFYRTGLNFTNTVAFSGGTESINFRLSLSDMNAEAILPKSSINRTTANLNLNAFLGKRLSIQAIGQYNLEKGRNRPKVGYADHNTAWATYLVANTVDIRTLSPGYDLNFNETMWNATSEATNPYFVVNRYSNDDKKNRLIGQLNIKYDILKNLYIKAGISQDYYNFIGNSVIPTGTGALPRGSLSSSQANVSETNSLLSLNYSSSILRNFNLVTMAGGNLQKSEYDETRIVGSEFTIPYFYSYTNVAALTTTPVYNQSKINSIFGSLDLDYKRVAFLSITARKDWFSTLSPKNNSILYPSIGGSFIVSEVINMPSAINFLKVRGSWAQVGGATPDPYILNQTFNMLQGGHNGQPVQLLSSGLVANSDLRPLTSTTYEAGIDVQTLNNRLSLDLTFYNRKTTDDIVRTTISSSSGYTQALLNIGEVSNQGIEMMISGKPVKAKNFSWDISYNVAHNKSKIVQLAEGIENVIIGNGVAGGVVQHVIGRPYGTVWGFNHAKNDQGQTVFNTNSNRQVRSELMELGEGVAPLTMGLINNFNYKDFSLNILLDGKFGNTIWSNTNWYATRFGLPKSTLPGRENGLDLNGVDDKGAPYTYKVPVGQIDDYYNSQRDYTGLFAFDGSFIKLRQIILGYQLPTAKIKFVNLQSASISLVARNPFILYRKTENFDPESSNTSDNAQGLEAFGLPRTRSMGINLLLKF